MSVWSVTGGNRLDGSLRVQGAKNSVLPILAASILVGSETELLNCPDLSDVDSSIDILRHLGCEVESTKGRIFIDSS